MCWTMRQGTGRLAGRVGRMSCRAFGPPVEVPMSSNSAWGEEPSLESWAGGGVCAFGAARDPATGAAGAAGVDAGRAGAGTALWKRGLEARRRTFSCRSFWICRMLMLAKPLSFGMKSRAPKESASRVAWAPSWVRLDTISTGMGCCAMIFFRQVRPSIRGISISRVTRSGLYSSIFSRASMPSRAVATTRRSGASSNIFCRDFRMKGLSSTTSIRIVIVLSPMPGRPSRRRPGHGPPRRRWRRSSAPHPGPCAGTRPGLP